MNKPPLTLAVSLALAAMASQSAQAATSTWNCTDSYWDIASCWSPTGVPTKTSTAIVGPVGLSNTIVKFDTATGAQSVQSLTLTSTTAYTVHMNQSGGDLNAQIQSIGSNAGYNQSGGTNSANSLYVGNSWSGASNYTLSGKASLSSITQDIGSNGYGDFVQNGGTNNVDTLHVGSGTSGIGSYNLNSGSLTARYETVDNYSSFTQSGGTHNVLMTLGLYGISLYGDTTSSTYTLKGGTLSADKISGDYASKLILDGGTLNASSVSVGSLVLGATVGSNGTHTLSGWVHAEYETIGQSGAGRFTQTGGSHNVDYGLSFATFSGSSGSYTLKGGLLSIGGNIVTGSGTGTLNLDGGTLTVGGGNGSIGVTNLVLGSTAGSFGSHTLSGTGSITASNVTVGGAGSGTLTQTGGTLTTANLIVNDTYIHGGGSLVVNGNLSNNGSMTLSGGTTTVNGSMTNATGAKIEVANSPAIFTGDVVNNGIFKLTNTKVTFAGTYTENGAFISDPSQTYATHMIIGTGGYLVGGVGDEWHISGNFENHSLQNTMWNTDSASLFFNGVVMQNVYLAGGDMGAVLGGFHNNFAWGELSVGTGAQLTLLDGNTTSGAALYVGLVELGDGLGQLANIYSDYNIYYDSSLAGNAWLAGKTYALNGTGYLMAASAVPVPAAAWLLSSGLLGLVGVARRKNLS